MHVRAYTIMCALEYRYSDDFARARAMANVDRKRPRRVLEVCVLHMTFLSSNKPSDIRYHTRGFSHPHLSRVIVRLSELEVVFQEVKRSLYV